MSHRIFRRPSGNGSPDLLASGWSTPRNADFDLAGNGSHWPPAETFLGGR